MIYAHLPAGYITSRLLFGKFEKHKVSYDWFRFWGMIGAIAPDFDLFYFFFIDENRFHHHEYITHFPLFWLALLLLSVEWMQIDRCRRQMPVLAVIFTLNGFIHMILDTLVGSLHWLAPFGTPDQLFSLQPYNPVSKGFLEYFIFLFALYLLKREFIPSLRVFFRIPQTDKS
jgi:hypothetical protein